jgi:hypothetical protein
MILIVLKRFKVLVLFITFQDLINASIKDKIFREGI